MIESKQLESYRAGRALSLSGRYAAAKVRKKVRLPACDDAAQSHLLAVLSGVCLRGGAGALRISQLASASAMFASMGSRGCRGRSSSRFNRLRHTIRQRNI